MSPAPKPTAQRTKRLHLLDAAEVAALYDCPCFTDEERAYYFALTPTEAAHMQTFTDGAVQAFFVLQLGYFKTKPRFFSVQLAEVAVCSTVVWPPVREKVANVATLA